MYSFLNRLNMTLQWGHLNFTLQNFCDLLNAMPSFCVESPHCARLFLNIHPLRRRRRKLTNYLFRELAVLESASRTPIKLMHNLSHILQEVHGFCTNTWNLAVQMRSSNRRSFFLHKQSTRSKVCFGHSAKLKRDVLRNFLKKRSQT